jgi:hypothetical protein
MVEEPAKDHNELSSFEVISISRSQHSSRNIEVGTLKQCKF